MLARRPKTKAFGVEPNHATYRLRQARYYELATDVSRFAQEHFARSGRPINLMDVGTFNGLARRYIEVHPGGEHVRYHAVDLFLHKKEVVYKHQDWTLHALDLEQGMPTISSSSYDVVVAEQVLEHLHNPARTLAEISRVVRPGGLVIVGVPIFLPLLALARIQIVRRIDQWRGFERSHVQSWSMRSFLRLWQRTCPELKIQQVRGFRIVSGGLLRPLEYTRWWWQLNRRIGAAVPSLCIEIQVVAHKPAKIAAAPRLARAA